MVVKKNVIYLFFVGKENELCLIRDLVKIYINMGYLRYVIVGVVNIYKIK